MKKMLSLAAMLAVISYASPASAELKISGDAATRVRGEFNNSYLRNESDVYQKVTNSDDLKFQYKVRLKASADLGDGYFFKTLIANEETSNGGTPGWSTVGSTNSEKFQLEVSNFYFGRMMEESQYMIGRLPLNSFNNPIFDITLYPVPTTFTNSGVYAVDVPVFQWNYDRVYGMKYGTKVGDGDLKATLVVLDNNSVKENTVATGDGLFNDGYLLHLFYKTNIGDVTVEPQAIITLTDAQGAAYQKISPNTFGANATIPVGKSKLGLSGFYTVCKDNKGITTTSVTTYQNNAAPVVTVTQTPTNVDYNAYLLRVKGESGPVMAWIDYNRTNDNSRSSVKSIDVTYNNIFVWAQYKVNVHESALGTVSLTPTLRYRASGKDTAGIAGTEHNNQLRTELWASVTF
jgi:hypothetical protein